MKLVKVNVDQMQVFCNNKQRWNEDNADVNVKN